MVGDGNWNGSRGNWIRSHGLRSGSCVANAARSKWERTWERGWNGVRVGRMKCWVTEWWAWGSVGCRRALGQWSMALGVQLFPGGVAIVTNGLLWEFIRSDERPSRLCPATGEWMKERMNERTNELMNERANKEVNGSSEWKKERMNEWMRVRYKEWMSYCWHNEEL